MAYLGKMSKETFVDSSSIFITSPFSGENLLISQVLTEFETFLKDLYCPVGTIIYLSDNTHPSSLYPGTWEKIANGQVLIASDSEVLTKGGAYTHTLTSAEMPAHQHQAYRQTTARSTNQDPEYGGGSGTTKKTSTTGTAYAHNNMMPCSAHNCWRRIL